MARHLPPLNWIRSFEASARHESFTLAAEELGLTQTAVSQHVKLLEQQLHRPLFIRRPRSLILTEAGKVYYPKLTELLNQLGTATAEIFGGFGEARLTLQVNAAYSVLFLAPRLPDFIANNPDIPLRILNPVWPAELAPENVDFEIRYGSGSWPGWRSHRLSRDRIFPVTASDSPLQSGGDKPARKGLSEIPRLSVMGYREGWPDWFRAAGMSNVREREIQCDNSIMAYELARRGPVPALGRSTLVAEDVREGKLKPLGGLSIESSEDFYLLMPESRARSRNAATFMAWILDEAEREMANPFF